MGEPTGRAAWRDLRLLLLPAAIGLLVALAVTMQAALATHGGPHVRLVNPDNPGQDLSIDPLLIGIGQQASIDFVIELPSSSDNLYAAEFHFDFYGDQVFVLTADDGNPDMPGFNLELDGPGLALEGKERLRLPVEGFPDNGTDLRTCVPDPVALTGDDSVYTFVKGGSGDSFTTIDLQLLDQHQRPEWGANWCGPTAAGISLAWFAETNTADHGSLMPSTLSLPSA